MLRASSVPSRSAVPERTRTVRGWFVAEAAAAEEEEGWYGDSKRHSPRGSRVMVRVREEGGGCSRQRVKSVMSVITIYVRIENIRPSQGRLDNVAWHSYPPALVFGPILGLTYCLELDV